MTVISNELKTHKKMHKTKPHVNFVKDIDIFSRQVSDKNGISPQIKCLFSFTIGNCLQIVACPNKT